MTTPNNTLQNVQVYAKAELAWMINSFYAIQNSNKKFNNFENTVMNNLGNVVTFDLAPRYIGYNGLVITQQKSEQRILSLAVTQAYNISSGYTDEQFIFNVEDYMPRFGEAAALEMGALVEADILQNFISGVVGNNPNSSQNGVRQTYSGPYRFYGDGVTAINSYGQLAQMVANFEAFGCARNKRQAVLPVDIIPGIVNTGLNQFALNRNNSDAEYWELGRFSETDWFTSNLLPTQVAGTIGNSASPNNVLTVVSVDDPTGQNVTQITCTEPTSGTDVNAVKAGDMGQFISVSGKTDVKFLTFIGHKQTVLPAQIRVTANAGTTAGTVVISITPSLVWAQNQNQNINTPIVAGMKIQLLPTHRAGCLHSGDQFYAALPMLPDQPPYSTVRIRDKESGASMRHYFGVQFGQDNRAYVRDEIHGSTLVPENSMRIVIPA